MLVASALNCNLLKVARIKNGDPTPAKEIGKCLVPKIRTMTGEEALRGEAPTEMLRCHQFMMGHPPGHPWQMSMANVVNPIFAIRIYKLSPREVVDCWISENLRLCYYFP